MERIEGIAEIPEWLCVIALPAIIEPDREQSKQRESLLNDLKLQISDMDCIVVAAEYTDVQNGKSAQLGEP